MKRADECLKNSCRSSDASDDMVYWLQPGKHILCEYCWSGIWVCLARCSRLNHRASSQGVPDDLNGSYVCVRQFRRRWEDVFSHRTLCFNKHMQLYSPSSSELSQILRGSKYFPTLASPFAQCWRCSGRCGLPEYPVLALKNPPHKSIIKAIDLYCNDSFLNAVVHRYNTLLLYGQVPVTLNNARRTEHSLAQVKSYHPWTNRFHHRRHLGSQH